MRMLSFTYSLTPPYAELLPVLGIPELGAILVVNADIGVVALGEGLNAWHAAPWCPLCFTTSGAVRRADLTAVLQLDTAYALVSGGYPGEPIDPSAIVRAIRDRLEPSAKILAQYVAIRMRRRPAVPYLESAFRSRINGAERQPSARTLSRRIADLGPLTVGNWAGIDTLIRILLRRGRSAEQPTLERVALESSVDPRSVRAWLRLCTNLSVHEVFARVGWEWVLESALRTWGYVTGHEVQWGHASRINKA